MIFISRKRSKIYELEGLNIQSNFKKISTLIWILISLLLLILMLILVSPANTSLPLRHCVKSIETRICFWSVFSRVWTEYGDLQNKSPYSVLIQENAD